MGSDQTFDTSAADTPSQRQQSSLSHTAGHLSCTGMERRPRSLSAHMGVFDSTHPPEEVFCLEPSVPAAASSAHFPFVQMDEAFLPLRDLR